MAYERRFSVIFISLITWVSTLFSAPIHSAGEGLRSIASMVDRIEFHPSVAISIALDRLARFFGELIIPVQVARARSFHARALLHEDWHGDHYSQRWLTA